MSLANADTIDIRCLNCDADHLPNPCTLFPVYCKLCNDYGHMISHCGTAAIIKVQAAAILAARKQAQAWADMQLHAQDQASDTRGLASVSRTHPAYGQAVPIPGRSQLPLTSARTEKTNEYMTTARKLDRYRPAANSRTADARRTSHGRTTSSRTRNSRPRRYNDDDREDDEHKVRLSPTRLTPPVSHRTLGDNDGTPRAHLVRISPFMSSPATTFLNEVFAPEQNGSETIEENAARLEDMRRKRIDQMQGPELIESEPPLRRSTTGANSEPLRYVNNRFLGRVPLTPLGSVEERRIKMEEDAYDEGCVMHF